MLHARRKVIRRRGHELCGWLLRRAGFDRGQSRHLPDCTFAVLCELSETLTYSKSPALSQRRAVQTDFDFTASPSS